MQIYERNEIHVQTRIVYAISPAQVEEGSLCVRGGKLVRAYTAEYLCGHGVLTRIKWHVCNMHLSDSWTRYHRWTFYDRSYQLSNSINSYVRVPIIWPILLVFTKCRSTLLREPDVVTAIKTRCYICIIATWWNVMDNVQLKLCEGAYLSGVWILKSSIVFFF